MSVSLSIKDVPNEVVRRLRARAKLNHRSIQGELMSILETAVERLGRSRLRALARDQALGLSTPAESVQMIREDRDR